jgi:uncharacterized protein (DUF1778 family)
MAALKIERGRISLRCTKAQQERIATAATLTGATINQFVLQAALEKADLVIERERGIIVAEADAAMILALLENPPAPNEKLAALLASYKEKVDNGTLRTNAGPSSASNW